MADIKQAAKKKFSVWIGQINQTRIEVEAKDLLQAKQRAIKKWMEEECMIRITDVQELEK